MESQHQLDNLILYLLFLSLLNSLKKFEIFQPLLGKKKKNNRKKSKLRDSFSA